MSTKHLLIGLFTSILTLSMAGCGPRSGGVIVHSDIRPAPRYVRPAPPPRAPAHGYRHRHSSGVDVEFDSGLGVYFVIGYPGIYYYSDHYFRYYDGDWLFSFRYDGPWERAVPQRVPRGLLKRHPYKKPHPRYRR